VLLSDHVAQIDPNPKPDPAFLGHLGLAVNHPALDLDSATHRVHDTRKFREQAVASMFDCAPTVLFDLRIDQLA